MPSKTLKIVGSVALVGTLAALAVLNMQSDVQGTNLAGQDNESLTAFNKFISTHHKGYITRQEYNARFANFKNSYEFVKMHNKANHTHKVALNSFADWAPEEINSILSLQLPEENEIEDEDEPITETQEQGDEVLLGAPASVNWVSAGAVTAVKNQGKCASCYAFSAAGAMEGAYKIKKGVLHTFSPQQLTDCTTGWFRNGGCGGGYMTNCYNYLKSNFMIKDSDYPYTGARQSCKYGSVSSKGITKVSSYTVPTINSHDAIMNAVAKQPVSAAVAASSSLFIYYKTGIISSTSCGTGLNHAILIVGYGKDSATNTPYWLVKNSWGSAWGEKGYFRVLRQPGSTGNPGICGIQKLPSYPNIA